MRSPIVCLSRTISQETAKTDFEQGDHSKQSSQSGWQLGLTRTSAAGLCRPTNAGLGARIDATSRSTV